MRTLPTLTALVVTAGLACLAPRPAAAQQTHDPAKSPAPAPASAQVSMKQLKKFAAAYPDIRAEANTMNKALAGATTAASKRAIRTRSNTRMIATLKAHGLSPQEYAHILTAINTNSDLRTEFGILVQQQQQKNKKKGGKGKN